MTIRDHLRARLALFGFSGLLLGLVVFVVTRSAALGESAEESLARSVANEGLSVETSSVIWFGEEQSPFRHQPALFVGRAPGSPSDLWYADVRLTDSGAVLDVVSLTNVTRTSSAAEHSPARSGSHLAYLSDHGETTDAVTVVDLRGESSEATDRWPMRARVQNGITNVQETGRWRGFGRRRYALRPSAEEVSLAVEAGAFVVVADGTRIVLEPGTLEPREGAERVEVREMEKAEPGTITWVVDTIRDLSFVGPEPIAWLEHRVFAVKDWLQRKLHGTIGETRSAEVVAAEELDVTVEEIRRRLELSVTDPELGWPPAAVEPVVRRPAEGEGEWVAVVDDPWVASYPNAPTAFYTTFLQVDMERPWTRVYIVLWDPRQVQLRVMSGTQEPESATGETGPGIVPRDPGTLSRLVGGFNGGFQSLHGEFGMMSDGDVYLPPKPWAATVAVYDDGTVGMGSWQDPPEGVESFEESWATQQIPGDMVEFRQNLTSVVEDGRYNPWRRWWWGAAPQNAEDQVFIDRSGLCMTEGGFMAYFWGKSMGADELGSAMLATRCVRGMHLDMNQRHTAFEFYNVKPRDEAFPRLGVRRRFHQFEMRVPLAEDFHVRGRMLVRSMTPMRFPRYIRRDGRDFFYLTLKPVLPGPHLPSADPDTGEGIFVTHGLPHAGWPHAFARTYRGAEPGERTWMVRIDPARALAAPVAGERAERPLAWITGVDAAARAEASGGLWARRQSVGWRYGVGETPEDGVLLVPGASISETPDAPAAIGVDGDGFLVYAERQPGDELPLPRRLAEAGVESAIALPEGVRLAFDVEGQTIAPDSFERAVEPEGALAFFAHERPATEVLNPEVEPRPYMHWYRMQDTRVRYFRGEGPSRFRAPEDATEPPRQSPREP